MPGLINSTEGHIHMVMPSLDNTVVYIVITTYFHKFIIMLDK